MSERPVAQELPHADLSANLPVESLFALVEDLRKDEPRPTADADRDRSQTPRLTLIRGDEADGSSADPGDRAATGSDEAVFKFEDQIERAEQMCAEAMAPALAANADEDKDELLMPVDLYDLDAEIEVDDSFAAGLDLDEEVSARAEAETAQATIEAADIVRPNLRIVNPEDVEDGIELDPERDERRPFADASQATDSAEPDADIDESESQDIVLIAPGDGTLEPTAELGQESETVAETEQDEIGADDWLDTPSGRPMPPLPVAGEIAALARGAMAAPRRIGSGHLVPARLTWKPGDPFGEDKAPTPARFRWEVMLTASCVTAACGMGFMWLVRTVFAG